MIFFDQVIWLYIKAKSKDALLHLKFNNHISIIENDIIIYLDQN